MNYQKRTKTITGAYTTTDADIGERIICNSASPFTITLHTATGRYNFELEIDNIGAGAVTVGGQTVGQYQHAHVGNNGGTAWTVVIGGGGGGSGAESFTDLDDAPSSYTGQAEKYLAVKATEDGLEFVSAPGGGTASIWGEML